MVKLINIDPDSRAVFRSRPNRFLAYADITWPEKISNTAVHVHDPGRLGELLYPGNEILVNRADGPHRKTSYDLIAARNGEHWIPVNTTYHRQISERILSNRKISPFGAVEELKAEIKHGHSRLDFLVRDSRGYKIWVETKGCTLAENGIAKFPDAPTLRGRKHVEELISLKNSGERAALIFLIFRPDSTSFSPNAETDPGFSESLIRAYNIGVEIYPLLLEYLDGWVYYRGIVEIFFK